MKNYVISLTTAIDRREHINQEFGKQGIDFEFFDAVTPEQTPQLCQTLGIHLMDNQQLTDGEKACFISHVSLWQKMLDDNIDYMAIFEDDVYLGENAHLIFNEDAWLHKNSLDIVKTETFLQERKLDQNAIELMDGRKLHLLKEQHFGAAGYILSQKAAQKLLHSIQSLNANQITPIDVILFEDFVLKSSDIQVYQLLPAVCIQEFILKPNDIAMPSSLENLRAIKRKQKPKRSWQAKLKGELSNIFRKTIGKFIRTKIEFR